MKRLALCSRFGARHPSRVQDHAPTNPNKIVFLASQTLHLLISVGRSELKDAILISSTVFVCRRMEKGYRSAKNLPTLKFTALPPGYIVAWCSEPHWLSLCCSTQTRDHCFKMWHSMGKSAWVDKRWVLGWNKDAKMPYAYARGIRLCHRWRQSLECGVARRLLVRREQDFNLASWQTISRQL